MNRTQYWTSLRVQIPGYGWLTHLHLNFMVTHLHAKKWTKQKLIFVHKPNKHFPSKDIDNQSHLCVSSDYSDSQVWLHSHMPRLSLSDTLRFMTSDRYSTHHCILYEKVAWTVLSVRQDVYCFLFIYELLKVNMSPYISTLLNSLFKWLFITLCWNSIFFKKVDEAETPPLFYLEHFIMYIWIQSCNYLSVIINYPAFESNLFFTVVQSVGVSSVGFFSELLTSKIRSCPQVKWINEMNIMSI